MMMIMMMTHNWRTTEAYWELSSSPIVGMMMMMMRANSGYADADDDDDDDDAQLTHN